MKITLKDGSVKEYGSAMSVIDIANDISEGLGRAACAGEINGKVVDLRTVVDSDCELSILTFNDEEGKKAYRHTASHVLAEAVKRLYPEAKCAIGPAIDEGFYYDFDTPPFSRDDLDKLEAEIKKIIKEGHELTRFTLSRDEAIKFMEEKGEPYKVELIKDLPEGAEISFYDQGGFVDLCAGPHLMSTKYLKAVKLISSSGAYWRGNEKNKMLTRIYGTAFTKNADMDAYLAHLEDIKLRDHNRLGREMKLFTTVDVIGQGLPLFTPKGTKMIQILQRWIEDLEDNEWGYVRTRTPLMAKSDLYKISGHWDHYMDGMFILNKESEGTKDGKEVMALRPMTCPFQYYVYMNEQRSYRDLPYRMSETSTLFRNEDSGEMHGLTRVRQFTITEGHIVLRPDQAEEELTRCVELANYVMTTLGVQGDVTYRLSKWDPENKDKYEGDEAELLNLDMFVEHVDKTAPPLMVGELWFEVHLATEQAVAVVEYAVDLAGIGEGVLVAGDDVAKFYHLKVALLHVAHFFQFLLVQQSSIGILELRYRSERAFDASIGVNDIVESALRTANDGVAPSRDVLQK